ncbi:MAG: hypothetical protein L3J96_08000, partial [Thermoplasmata archaeon]|nr:hypothetical protein [Thermoplasmata archaeon]
MRSPSAVPFRTIGFVGLLVAIMVISGFAGVTLGARHSNTSASPGVGASGIGPAQTSAAATSLARGEGPAMGHPSTVPVSPGGYTWTNISSVVTGTTPPARLGTIAWDASDGYVVMWGWASLAGSLRDTWTYLNGTWTNITSTVSASPPISSLPVMTYDPSTQKIVVYSGFNNSTWTYHDKVWTNVTAMAGAHPPSVYYESFVTDSTDNQAVLFGGTNLYSGGANTYTWVYKNGAWSNMSSSAPFHFGRILLPVLADDPADHGVLAVGLSEWMNVSPTLFRPATFLFSGGAWTNLTPTLPLEPAMPYLSGSAYVPAISAVVLMEGLVVNSTGYIGDSAGQTWEFSHGVWTNVTTV